MKLTKQQLAIITEDITSKMQAIQNNHTILEEEHGLYQASMTARQEILEAIQQQFNDKPSKPPNNSTPNAPANPKP